MGGATKLNGPDEVDPNLGSELVKGKTGGDVVSEVAVDGGILKPWEMLFTARACDGTRGAFEARDLSRAA